jgi:TolA-binding protein
MRNICCEFLGYLMLAAVQVSLHAQTVPSTSTSAPTVSAADTHSIELERKLEAISSALAETRQQLDQSRQEIEQLRQEVVQMKKQFASAQPATAQPSNPGNTADAAKTTAAAIEDLQERQQMMAAQIKVHDQTKVESSSKYPLHVTGLILFNSFINRGNVDNIDLPEAAVNSQSYMTSSGSAGASFRQTILGLEGNGPKIAGARTSGSVDLDFFGGVAYSSYATSAGTVRMRTASINLDWTNDSIQVGMVMPLISPLSPTSYATVAEPALAGAGNLWTWAPQLRYMHKIPLQSGRQLQFELGLWDPPAAGYSTNQLFRAPSPGEASSQPGYESRISYRAFAGEHPLEIGLSGYYSRQSYPGNQKVDSWAGTTDWRVPLGSHFEVSGEGYRGKAIGGLGGGAYKDVLFGAYSSTGLNTYHALNAIGGWTQLKARFNQSLEANASIGLDNGYGSDFHELVFPPTVTATELRARNKMVFGNLIFKPKTYLILSPEYRRIWTWPIYGNVSTADIFTLSAGYQF